MQDPLFLCRLNECFRVEMSKSEGTVVAMILGLSDRSPSPCSHAPVFPFSLFLPLTYSIFLSLFLRSDPLLPPACRFPFFMPTLGLVKWGSVFCRRISLRSTRIFLHSGWSILTKINNWTLDSPVLREYSSKVCSFSVKLWNNEISGYLCLSRRMMTVLNKNKNAR